MICRIHPVLILLLFFFFTGTSQGPLNIHKTRTCATPVPPAEWDQWFNNLIAENKMTAALRQEAALYKIPVVVHIIHSGEQPGTYPNLGQDQVLSQINALNADFSGNGTSSDKIPAPFTDDVANCNIVFSMAQLDPSGRPLVEPGIHRVNWATIGPDADPKVPISSSGFQSYFDKTVKPATIWDPDRYFNIWVSDVKSTLDLLGYSTFPTGTGLNGLFNGNGTATTDGVWIWASAFGTTGILHKQYDLGRTATHEIGHSLGLRHIWGDVSCGDDYCDDTPKQQSMNLGCPNFPKVSCSNGPEGEMFMNFMDYCDDVCLSMFTWDQMVRMQTAMQKGQFRKNLTASSATLCDLPAAAPEATFNSPASACANTFVVIENRTTGMPAPVYTWEINPPTGVETGFSESTGDPVLVFGSPGNYDVKVTAVNGSGTSTYVKIVSVSDCGLTAGVGKSESLPGITVFPNPGSGRFAITGKVRPGMPLRIAVYNAYGQQVFLTEVTAEERIDLDLSGMPDGIYFAEVEQGDQRELKKLILAH